MANIFLKDPDGKGEKVDWFGPYSEKKVQDWYREKRFTNRFEFIFKDDEIKPSADAKGTTLSELKKHNGDCSVFEPVDPLKTCPNAVAHRISELEKKLEVVQAQLDTFKGLEARMATFERMIELLTKESPPWEQSAEESIEDKKEEPEAWQEKESVVEKKKRTGNKKDKKAAAEVAQPTQQTPSPASAKLVGRGGWPSNDQHEAAIRRIFESNAGGINQLMQDPNIRAIPISFDVNRITGEVVNEQVITPAEARRIMNPNFE